MTLRSRSFKILALLTFLGNSPIGVVLLLVNTSWGKGVLADFHNHHDFGAVIAGFAFGMMGFLVAITSLFTLLGQSRAMSNFKESGNLQIYLMALAVAIGELAITFIASLQLFVGNPPPSGKLVCVIAAAAGSFGMVIVSTTPVIGLQIRAAGAGRQ